MVEIYSYTVSGSKDKSFSLLFIILLPHKCILNVTKIILSLYVCSNNY